ncbi:MAG: tetratricopeptide repeat protein [Aureliella sp.]
MFAFAFVLVAANSQTLAQQKQLTQEVNSTVTNAERALYEQAASLIRDGQHESAIDPLVRLVETNPNSDLATTARYFLSQSYLVSKKPEAAYEVLSRKDGEWPQAMTRAVQQAIRISAMAAGKAALVDGDQLRAIKWFRVALHKSDGAGREVLEKEIQRIAYAGILADYESADQERCFCNQLATATALGEKQIAEIKLACGETLIKRGKRQAALALYESLLSEQTASAEQNECRDVMLLRIAELQLNLRDVRGAKATIAKSKQSQPSQLAESIDASKGASPNRIAFQFLAARCHIADIEFDEALTALKSISQTSEVSESDRAKAAWMQGEVYFLQRKYSEAIIEYESVDRLDQGKWRRAAWLQRAKCYELTGQVSEAYSLYSQISEQYRNSPESENAVARMAAIGTSSQTHTTVTR